MLCWSHGVGSLGGGAGGVGRRVLRGPGDNAGRRVGVEGAREHGVQAADVPVVVVALDGHGGRVWRRHGDKQAANQNHRFFFARGGIRDVKWFHFTLQHLFLAPSGGRQ